MSLLEKLLGGSKTKAKEGSEAKLAALKESLKSVLYEDELVDEFLPIFQSFSSIDGFEKVMELITTKEKQIAAIAGGDWFKEESSDESDEEQEIVTPTKGTKSKDDEEDPLIKLIEQRNSNK